MLSKIKPLGEQQVIVSHLTLIYKILATDLVSRTNLLITPACVYTCSDVYYKQNTPNPQRGTERTHFNLILTKRYTQHRATYTQKLRRVSHVYETRRASPPYLSHRGLSSCSCYVH